MRRAQKVTSYIGNGLHEIVMTLCVLYEKLIE